MSPTAPVLSVEDLTVEFAVGSDGPAVDGISFAVRPGEIVALVGESGSGKTVTANAVLGLLPDSARVRGRISVDDTDVLGLDERGLRAVRGVKVGMVFQEPGTALNPVEKVGWQIAEAQRAHRKVTKAWARARAVELLAMVHIPDPEQRVDYYPHQLSGGQKQRVVIALALANEPDLIIADEPTTALDVTVQAEILRLLREVRDRYGRAVLVITHNMGVVADLADRVIVMRSGKIVEDGDVYDVFARPSAAYTKQLLDAVPKLAPARAEAEPAGPHTDKGRNTDEVLHFADLTVDYPGRLGRPPFRALTGVDLSVKRGDVVGLVGESGSGKTTLARTAVGLIRPTSGTARLLGADLRTVKGDELRNLRRRIGFVFQDPGASLDPRRTVGDAVGEPLRVHDLAKGARRAQRIGELLESVQLPKSYADRLPAELSGGQRQRVGVARAVALNPDLVIADEPTSALDVSVQADVLKLFAELREQLGFGCVFISHDLAVVDDVADWVVVLRGGEVVESGSPNTVLRTPRTEYARRLVGAVTLPDPVLQRAHRSSSTLL